MSEFQAYLQVGFEHITDPNGYDHVLFIVALCAIYRLPDWKRVLILVTAFTVGHSVTLALATLQLVQFRSEVIEFLIPITILLTAVGNFFYKADAKTDDARFQWFRYVLAVGFGLIHGLGFSSYLRSLLGKEQSIVQPLLAFNLGLEIGQLVIVFALLVVATLFGSLFRVSKHNWNLAFSGIVAGMALSLIINSELLN